MTEDMIEKLEPVLGAKAKKLYMAWMLSDKEEKLDLEQYIKALYLKHIQELPSQRQVILSPPPSNLCSGDVLVGTTHYKQDPKHPFYLRKPELAQHVAVFGRTGSGKTNTIRVLLKEFLKQKLPFLVFDWKKDYSQLDFEKVFCGIGICERDILVLPVGRRNVKSLRLNPLIPPKNTSPEVWIKQLCEVLTHAYLGGPGFESILLEAFDHCYKEAGIYEGSSTYPTFLDVKNYLKNKKCSGREALWMQSVMRTINNICFGGMNETINSAEPDDLASLLEKNVILELDTLSNTDKTFITETILLWLHHHRLQNPPKNVVDNVLVIEEAHHLLRKHDSAEESLIESCLREMRSLGIGILIVDQMPSLISKVALANTYTTIALNVKTGDDVAALTKAMLLTSEEKEMLGRLAIGEAIIKLQDRYTRPFHTKIPYLDTGGKRIIHYQEKPPSSRIPNIPQSTSQSTPRAPPAGRVPPKIRTPSSAECEAPGPAQAAQEKAATPASLTTLTTSHEDELLLDIAKNPTSKVTERYKRLGWSARKGNHYRQKLEKVGLIRPVTFAGLSAWLRLFELTETGVERVRSLGGQAPGGRKGGLEHQYWQETVAEHFKQQGFNVELEHHLNGHSIDIVASKENKKIAIEIETGKSNYKSNISACEKTNTISEVLVICTSKQILDQVLANLRRTKKQVKVITARSVVTGRDCLENASYR